MAVTVKVKSPTVDTHNHPSGVDVVVREGHLIVLDAEVNTVAIYAPGAWTRSAVER